jgi:thiosulfate dehydrogenase
MIKMKRTGIFVVVVLATSMGAWLQANAAENTSEGAEPLTVSPSRDWLGGIPHAPTEDWAVAFGGRLYDNWAQATFIGKPEGDHPAYPKWGKKKGYSTWRCKECHGWDYNGRDGVYGKGSHYTGIKGLRHLVGQSPDFVLKVIRDDVHQYSTDMIADSSAERLALFVTRGQHDIERYVNMESNRARGDAGLGERIFQNVCAACHGFDGRALNFKTMDNPEYIGTVATHAPWEALHKIRNGHPGVPMPALRFLEMQTLVDILSYAQTLPQENRP